MTKAAMLKKALGFPSGNMDHMGLNEYQNNTGWNSWNALGPMGHGFPAGGMQNAFGSNPYATQPNIQGNEAIMQSQQQLNNMNMLEQQHPQLNNYIKGAAQNNEKIQRSATGEDNGVSYKLRDEDHATGSSAWDSLNEFRKTSSAEEQMLATREYLKAAGCTDFQAGFYGALVDTGVDARLMKEAADKAAEQLGPELCAELYDVDFSVMEKLAVRGPAAVAEGITDFMTNSATRRASRKPLPGPTNWGKGQADAIQDLGARNQAPFVPASAPVPQGTQLTLPGFDAPKPQASAPTKPAPASDVSKPSPAPKKPGMSATDKAVLGGTAGVGGVAATTAALNSGGGDAGTATNTAGGAKGAPSKPSGYSETMDGALGDWGGIGKGINEVSNTLGADFLIDKILGEGQAAQMHPLLKVLLLAGGGMGIGGLLSGNNKMGLGGLGLAALPLLFQGTKGFGMMGGGDNKAAPDIDTSGVTYTPNEALDNAWADKVISPTELASLSKDPANLSSAIAHDDFGAMAQQIIDQTATRDPQGNWAAPKENKTVGDQLLGLAGADKALSSGGNALLGVFGGGASKGQIIEALTKPQDQSTPLAGGNTVPGMGLSPQQATMLYNKLQGMQAGARPTSPVANRRTLPPDNLPPVKKQPNQNTTNMINNIGLQ